MLAATFDEVDRLDYVFIKDRVWRVVSKHVLQKQPKIALALRPLNPNPPVGTVLVGAPEEKVRVVLPGDFHHLNIKGTCTICGFTNASVYEVCEVAAKP